MSQHSSISSKDIRILIVGTSSFNWTTGGGVTLSNLFRGLASDQIATLHQDDIEPSSDVCANHRRFAPEDFRHVWYIQAIRSPFVLLKRLLSGPFRKPNIGRRISIDDLLKRTFGGNIPSRGRISDGLGAWLNDVKPDLVYTFLGSNEVMSMSKVISKKLDIPVAIHIMDDWPKTAYRKTPFDLFEYFYMRSFVAWFMRKAVVRMAICPEMSITYKARYQQDFQSFQNTIDIGKWSQFRNNLSEKNKVTEIVYVGSIYAHAQAESLIEICQAVGKLVDDNQKFTLKIYSHEKFVCEYRDRISTNSGVEICSELDDNEKFFRVLARASVLLLPVNFDPISVENISLSMPTKIPAMLNSGTPIFAYGPVSVAQIQYAIREDWAHVVTDRNAEALAENLLRISTDTALRKKLSANAITCAKKYHDASVVRDAFQASLIHGSKRN